VLADNPPVVGISARHNARDIPDFSSTRVTVQCRRDIGWSWF